jgi:hypothetical protein
MLRSDAIEKIEKALIDESLRQIEDGRVNLKEVLPLLKYLREMERLKTVKQDAKKIDINTVKNYFGTGGY